MRDFKGMKRQRGRNRGGGQGKPQQHNANRAFESNGPDGVKARGNAQHIFEKYQQLARDAASSGDRVLAENYLQHAEHYFRVIRAVQPNRPAADIIGRDTFASGFDIDFEDESGAQAAAAAEPEAETQGEGGEDGERQGGGQPRQDRFEGRSRDDRFRDDRPRDRDRDRGFRDERPRDDRPRDRDDRPREDRFRDDRPRDDRPREDRFRDDRPRDRDDRPREDRPREDRPREDRPRDDRPREDRFREERPRDRDRERGRDRPRRDERPADPMAVVEPSGAPIVAEAPQGGRKLRSDDGEMSHAPAFLQPRAAKPEAGEGEETKPKTRRRRTTAAAADES